MTWKRLAIIASFDETRPTFLAAIDQIVSEMRPLVSENHGLTNSVVSCAAAFADTTLVRSQLAESVPELVADFTDAEIEDAHLATIAYLFSLALHEMMRAPLPALTPEPPSAEREKQT